MCEVIFALKIGLLKNISKYLLRYHNSRVRVWGLRVGNN
jgi:hypothetical protein